MVIWWPVIYANKPAFSGITEVSPQVFDELRTAIEHEKKCSSENMIIMDSIPQGNDDEKA